MFVEKKEVEKAFIEMQKEKNSSIEKLPIPGRLAKRWEKKSITLNELWNLNPQLYIGYRIDENNNKLDDDSGHLTLLLWRRTKDSKAKNMVEALSSLRNTKPNLHPQILHDMENINKDLALISNTSPNEHPLILLNDHGILPYTSGQVIDGNRRILALFESLRNGDIDESLPLTVYLADFPTASAISYNTVAFALDNKPIGERVSILQERCTNSNYID